MDTGVSEECSREIELNAGILMSNLYSPMVLLSNRRQLNDMLTKLGKINKGRGSAGNLRNYTRKEEMNKGWERLTKVSDHVGRMRELGKEEWGDYMAGLIDGGGSIRKGVIEIRLKEGEYSLAYKLKKEVGYGVVRELKEEEGIKYKVEKEEGREIISRAINGRLRTEKKVEELRRSVGWEVKSRREDGDMNNYWLAGLIDSRGKLEIGLKREGGIGEVELRLEIGLKEEEGLLRKVKGYLKGGDVIRKEKGIEVYRNTEMGGVYKVIRYLDKYKMRSRRYVNYIKYRKVYRIVTRGEHLTERGVKKIESIRSKGIIRD